ncbi:hypothetical protein [Haladaptatus caseinilyticus]|uniref:hypothetical protein n=1 Tax=Haladaptatus caseinilyticus TaxID=2993314 RepID=UPI00224B2B39|nr:hypothetical protein [Haladaptatus caseinilyticus]
MFRVESQQTRRSFLKISGTVMGGIAVGTTVTAAKSTDRFIVKSNTVSSADLESNGVEVVHDLSAVDLLVVSGLRPNPQQDDGLRT